MEYMFSIYFRKHRDETRREKGKQLVNFDYQNVNSFCSRPSLRQQRALVLCLHRVIQTRFLTNQSACFIGTVSYLLITHNINSRDRFFETTLTQKAIQLFEIINSLFTLI